jgi:hypothetical protein
MIQRDKEAVKPMMLKCPSCDKEKEFRMGAGCTFSGITQDWYCSSACAAAAVNMFNLRKSRDGCRCSWCAAYCDGSITTGHGDDERQFCSVRCLDIVEHRRSRGGEQAATEQVGVAELRRKVADQLRQRISAHEGHPVEQLSQTPGKRFVCVEWLRSMVNLIINDMEA